MTDTKMLISARRLGVALLLAGASWHSSAFAQTAPANGINEGDIVVTAQKREQSINDVGLSIAAIGGKMLAERQITTLSDLAAAVPGLTYTDSGSNTPVYTLRGIGFYETTLGAYPSVSIYMDEAPLPLPVMTKNIAFDLERVEVLKGPQGTLFGNNATGGAINYIAAKPKRDFSAGGTISYGRFNTISGEAYVNLPVSANAAVRVSTKIIHSDDWQKSYTSNLTTGKTETYAGRILFDADLSDRLRVQLNVNGWIDKSDPQAVQYVEYRPNFPGASSPVSTYPLAPRTPRAADFTPTLNPHSDNNQWQATARFDFDINDDITLTSLTSYVRYRQDMAYDGDGVALRDFDVSTFDGKADSFSQELRIANGNANSFRWVVGANYARDKAADNYVLEYQDSTILSGSGVGTNGFRSSQLMKNYAVFANASLDVGQLTVEGGVRYTKANRDARSCFYVFPGPFLANFQSLYSFLSETLRAANGLPPGGPPPVDGCYTLNTTGILGAAPDYRPSEFIGKLNEDNVSFRGGINWKPNRDLLFYANVAKGYKAGSFPSAGAATFDQLLGVTQESVLSYEAGVKATLLDGALQANASGFYYDYKDKQMRSKLVDPVFGLLDALVNIPKSKVTGFEIELQARPTRGFDTYMNLSYIKSEITNFIGYSAAGSFDNFKGAPFPYTPKYSVGTGFNYEFPVSSSLDMFVGADLSHRSATTAIIGNARGFEIGSYTLLDVRGGIAAADDRWRIQLWGKNITNTYYVTNVGNFYDTLARFTGRPATYGVSLSMKFQ